MKYARFTKMLTIALEKEVYDQIRKISEEQRISMAEYLRVIVENALVEGGKREKVVSLTCTI